MTDTCSNAVPWGQEETAVLHEAREIMVFVGRKVSRNRMGLEPEMRRVLRSARQEKKLSYEDLAKQVGVSKSWIAQVLAELPAKLPEGVRAPILSVEPGRLKLLCEALGIDSKRWVVQYRWQDTLHRRAMTAIEALRTAGWADDRISPFIQAMENSAVVVQPAAPPDAGQEQAEGNSSRAVQPAEAQGAVEANWRHTLKEYQSLPPSEQRAFKKQLLGHETKRRR